MNNKEPLLTIIIPCYNAEKYFIRCASSLEGLDASNISLLFINDGSTDNTKELIEKWIVNHPNANIVNKQNGGYSTAINCGLDNCFSDYVMFLGVDDEIVSSGINRVCSRLASNRPDILAFSTVKKYDDKNDSIKEIDELTCYKFDRLYFQDLFDLCKNSKDANILFTRDTSRCFKRSIIGDIRYFGRTGVSADGCFSTLVALNARSFEFANEECYVWHLHSDSVSERKITSSRLLDEMDVWKSYFTNIQKICVDLKLPDPIINHIFVYARTISSLNQYGLNEEENKNKKYSKQLLKWARCSQYLSMKSRIKVTFPFLYSKLYLLRTMESR